MAFDPIWNIALGVLSICTAILGIVTFINTRLPSNKLHTMFELLQDADGLLLSCSEEGLVPSEAADDFREQLGWLRSRADEARLETLAAKSYSEDFANWLKGLTRNIDQICQNVREIRAEISTSSMRERERLAAQRRERQAAADEANASEDAVVGHAGSAAASQGQSQSVEVVEQPAKLVATPLSGAVPPSSTTPEVQGPPTNPRESVPATVFVRAHPPEIPSITARASTIKHPRKLRHSDRRCSISSNSSGSVASSLHSVRWKCKGDPLSRARAMATFLRYTHARKSPGLPVYLVNPQQLAACELADDDSNSSDEDWVDELAVRVVA
ncbi:hypothetical protein C8T65DRAFT_657001 [Cerioporus squamosus]|nr:hypothetical protein C8T65DRAFT_657001 [Cerioporus squamosus]